MKDNMTIDAVLTAAKNDRFGAFLSIADSIEPSSEGVLHDVPVAVKDNISVKKLPMTCGSGILEGYTPTEDAFAVQLLREAGAVIIGKTNMDEFAMGSYGNMSAFRPVLNPHDTKRRPGGSSSGSAAAVAAGTVPLALGSDTGGSVRLPAAYCGVYGFKPSWGGISRRGLAAHASSLDQIGILSASASLCRKALDVLAHKDQMDDTSIDLKRDIRRIDTLTVGIWKEQLASAGEEAVRATLSICAKLRNMGAAINYISCEASKLVAETYIAIAAAESVSCLARYDGLRFGRGIIGSVENTRSERLGAEVKSRIALGSALMSLDEYRPILNGALRRREEISQEINNIFDEVDIILGPAIPNCAPYVDAKKNSSEERLSDAFFSVANLAGIPAVVMPCGREEGMPLSVQMMSAKGEDFTLLSIAELLENCGGEENEFFA